MIKCSQGCYACCQHCKYAIYEELEIDGIIFNGEAVQCKIHPEETHVSGTWWCDDFHCFRSINSEVHT